MIRQRLSDVAHQEAIHVAITGMEIDVTTYCPFWHLDFKCLAIGLTGLCSAARGTLYRSIDQVVMRDALRAKWTFFISSGFCIPVVWPVE